MVFYHIQTLVNAGIDEISLVTGGPHAGHFIRVLKNGKDLGLKHLEFAYQDREGGISEALLFFKQVSDHQRFGVGKFDKNDKLVRIVEKPKTPPSNYTQTGLYIYDQTVFKKIKTLRPSKRGELEITDLNNIYLKEGTLQWKELEGYWRDAGTFMTLFEANKYWATKRNK